MSTPQQNSLATTSAGPAPLLSRIPTLATNRSGANSRLPSPPVSPGLSSPSTPPGPASIPLGLLAHGGASLTAGMLAQARERLSPSSSASSLSGVAAAPTRSIPMALGATPAAVLNRRQPTTPAGLPRSGSARTSCSGLAAGTPGQGALASADGTAAGSSLGANGSRSSIQVAVRLRPLCDKERQRGDRVAWAVDRDGNVGLLDAATGAFTPKHRFDTVFGPQAANGDVAAAVALPLVAPALAGINGTIFAYGVTSSGKTHTMMGTETDPGIVPRVIRELFVQIAEASAAPSSPSSADPSQQPSRRFSVRMSIMEIYNEVLNDLLDPLKTNLKVREDARSGTVLVEGLTELGVVSAEQALDLISRGDHNRKVSATAFNEDSSRSHTITRIVVDSVVSTPPAPDAPASTPFDRRRTTACLSLIDLAGSESARAVVSKGQRMEGSFINRSLLTLGTVIHKLAVAVASGSGSAGHVPFRDSKLTRLLQPSLSGAGARVAVVCNVTPAGAQTDETANTLKFAARAKLVQITARTNEALDERSLLRRYQKEVADLKQQLADARQQLSEAGVTTSKTGDGGAVGTEQSVGSALLTTSCSVSGIGTEALRAMPALLQAEQDARRNVEMEAMALKIKLARLQAFVESLGVNVDDLLTANTDITPSAAAIKYILQPPGSAAVATAAESSAKDGSCASGPAAEQNVISRTGGEGLDSHPAASDAPVVGSPSTMISQGGRLEQRSHELASIAAASNDLKFTGHQTKGSRCSVSSRSQCSASEVEEMTDDDLNEGLMEQIRDMICEAQLNSSSTPHTPQPRQPLVGAEVAAACTAQGAGGRNGSAAVQPGAGPLPAGVAAVGVAGGQLPKAGDAAAAAARGGEVSGRGGGGLPGSASSNGLNGFNGSNANGVLITSAASSCRRSTTFSVASSGSGTAPEGDFDVELQLQVLNADREVLYDQLLASERDNEKLTAQVADLRRQLGTYEQLTRQAANELVEIRRLKEAFQARLQQENELLKAQLAQLGVSPVLQAHPHQQVAAVPVCVRRNLDSSRTLQQQQQQSHQQQHIRHQSMPDNLLLQGQRHLQQAQHLPTPPHWDAAKAGTAG